MSGIPPLFSDAPANTRQTVLTSGEVFRLSLRPILRTIFFFLVAVLGFYIAWLSYTYGTVFQPALWQPLFNLTTGGVLLIWLALIFLLMYMRIRRTKTVGIPVAYGFNQDGLYIACAYFRSAVRWEHFSSVQEYSTAFLLNSGGQQFILPTTIWSEEELANLRRLLHAKARSTSRIAV